MFVNETNTYIDLYKKKNNKQNKQKRTKNKQQCIQPSLIYFVIKFNAFFRVIWLDDMNEEERHIFVGSLQQSVLSPDQCAPECIKTTKMAEG